MEKTGTKRNKKTAAYLDYMELENIIEAFGKAMRDANMSYIASPRGCEHSQIHFTDNMWMSWNRYIIYAMKQVPQ